MRDFGYVEGKQFDFTHRFADGYVERLPALAEELAYKGRPPGSAGVAAEV
jgi:hypothetical protein